MKKFIIGKKIGMTQIFDEAGTVVPVTVVEAGPCVVAQKKTIEVDGYESLQLGFGDISVKKATKPMQGHFKKADAGLKGILREFRAETVADFSAGDIIKADMFEAGDVVDVHGTSKGKGFQGPVKRHGSKTLKATHGTGKVGRHGGSLGAGSDPSRVMKGKKMAGHMGAETVTIKNLDIVKVDVENNLIAIKGAIPGPKGGIVTLTDSVNG